MQGFLQVWDGQFLAFGVPEALLAEFCFVCVGERDGEGGAGIFPIFGGSFVEERGEVEGIPGLGRCVTDQGLKSLVPECVEIVGEGVFGVGAQFHALWARLEGILGDPVLHTEDGQSRVAVGTSGERLDQCGGQV